MANYDVIVIGAGPAGSMAAMSAAKEGLNVKLIEKYLIPRYKACGGAVAQEFIDELNIPEDIIERRFSQLVLHHGDKEPVKRNSAGACLWRSNLDGFMTNLAREAGAEISDANKLIDIIYKDSKFTIQSEFGIDNCQIVIAADGVNSTTLASLGWRKFTPDELGMTIQKEIELPNKIIDERKITVWIDFSVGTAFPPFSI